MMCDPDTAVAAYNKLAKTHGWQSVCHSALAFQRAELCELLEIWHGLVRPDAIPLRKDFTPRLLRAHLSNVSIYECVVDDGRRRYRARVMGQRFTELLGNFNGRFFDEVMPSETAMRWQAVPDAVLAARAPLRFVSRLETAGRAHLTGEYLVAPLTGDDGSVNTVLSCGFFGATFALADAGQTQTSVRS